MIFTPLSKFFKNTPKDKRKWRVFVPGILIYLILYKCISADSIIRTIYWKILLFDIILASYYLEIKFLYFLKNFI